MKITEFPSVTELKETNIFLLDGPNGTKIIYALDLAKELLKLGGTDSIVGNIDLHDIFDENPSEITNPYNYLMIGTSKDGEYANKSILLNEVLYYFVDSKAGDANVKVPLKRMLFRGRNLGSVFTDEQKAAIADGSFKGLFLGDYWSIGGRIWRIVDFDYWYGKGDAITTTHHLVIMPDSVLFTSKMNNTATTAGGYLNSFMMTESIPTAKTIVAGAFGSSNILQHKELLTNAVQNGIPSAVVWRSVDVNLPCENMIYGTKVMSAMSNGTFVAGNNSVSLNQLAIAQIKPTYMSDSHSGNYWLLDICSDTDFAFSWTNGAASSTNANDGSIGVRPVFGLIG